MRTREIVGLGLLLSLCICCTACTNCYGISGTEEIDAVAFHNLLCGSPVNSSYSLWLIKEDEHYYYVRLKKGSRVLFSDYKVKKEGIQIKTRGTKKHRLNLKCQDVILSKSRGLDRDSRVR